MVNVLIWHLKHETKHYMKKQLLTFLAFILLTTVSLAQTVWQASTLAGNGTYANQPANTALQASFSAPSGLCFDALGNLYVSSGFTISKITPAGVVTTFAGSGTRGNKNGVGINADFYTIYGMCIDNVGNLYVNSNMSIRKIEPNGNVTTLCTFPPVPFSFHYYLGLCFSNGFLYSVNSSANKIYKVNIATGVYSVYAGSGAYQTVDGQGLNASFNEPIGICADQSGNLYVTQRGQSMIRKIDINANVTTIAGNGTHESIDGVGANASFARPNGIFADATGNLYVMDDQTSVIRKIEPNGNVTTILGGNVGDKDGVGKDANFHFNESKNVYNSWTVTTTAILLDGTGNLHFTDFDNRKIKKASIVTPSPPAANYLNLPGNLCMGSTVNYQPSVTGSQLGGNITIDSLSIAGAGSIKSFCQNGSHLFVLDNNNAINKYDFSGNLTGTFNANMGTTAITTDKAGKIYMVHPDGTNPSINTISRLDANGSLDFSFSSPQYYYSNISAIALDKDGYLYVADTTSGYIDKVDTLDGTPQHLPTPNPSFAYNKPTSLAFDKNGRMLLADIGHNTIMYRDETDNNYYPLITNFNLLNLKITQIGIDTVGFGGIYATSTITQKFKYLPNSEYGWQNFDTLTTFDYTQLKNGRPMGSAFTLPNGSALIPKVWVAQQSPAKLKNFSTYNYQISPALPAGLSYDFNRGNIIGTPTTPTPSQTYTITVYNTTFGNNSTTKTFGVSPSGFIGNTPGTATSLVNQADGLKVTYTDQNNCSKMIDIEDKAGGTVMGNTQVTQTVVPTIASFASGKFVGRVTEVNPQNPNAQARLKLYFTYTDIENYNLFNGAGVDLSNDTTVTKTMQVGILQLHRDSSGVEKLIKHNPVTANWISKEKAWVVDFDVQKFSTFYMSETSEIAAFTCASAGVTQSVTSCGDYFWRGQLLTLSGIYNDITANMYGCDSTLTLDLTVNTPPDVTVSTNGNVLSANETGATYQWINCNTNTAIAGETSQNFNVTSSGSYAVKVTKNNCSDTSSCVPITITGIETLNAHEGLLIYPNPNNGVFKITTTASVFVTITNSLGQTVLEQAINKGEETIDLSDYANGVYYATIIENKNIIRIKLVKQ